MSSDDGPSGRGNTYFWVDPHSQITGALHMQCLPFVTPDAMKLYVDFERAAYASSR